MKQPTSSTVKRLCWTDIPQVDCRPEDPVVPEDAGKAAVGVINNNHSNFDLDNTGFWWGDNGALILDVADDDLRGIVRYQWNASKTWVRWDFEGYYE